MVWFYKRSRIVDEPEVCQSDVKIIVGRQRSGTTVFRELLKTAGALDCDEVFHGDLNHPNRFYSFLLTEISKDPKLIHPRHHGALFWKFIEQLRKLALGKPIVMDIKYFALNLIPSQEDVEGRRPFLFNFMAESKACVVHIIRRNKLRVLVSEEIARATGRWSATQSSELAVGKPRTHVDAHQVVASIQRLIEQDEEVAQMLGSLGNVERLFYEEMFSGSQFSQKTLTVASRLMGQPVRHATPLNVRMNPEPLSELISNYREIASALRRTKFKWML